MMTTVNRDAEALFVSEVLRIESARAIPAIKQCMIENKMLTVADILKKCGIKVEYGKAPEPKMETVDEAGERKKFEQEELIVRIEAPFPWNSDLNDSARHWRSKVENLIFDGWQVVTWQEYEGERLMEKGVDGRLETSKQRVYYANALISKRPGSRLVTCKTHIKGQYRPVAMDSTHESH